MSVGIPLPELDVTKPTTAPYPDALSEFQRASQLQTAAAQQQAIMAQTQGQQQQNQMQAMQLHDEQLRRQLAPQFVQKDSSGKVTGFDNEGLYSAMLGGGADPMNIQKMRMSQVEMQKALLGLNAEQRKQFSDMHSDIQDSLEQVQKAYDQESKKTPPAVVPSSGAPAPLGPPVPGTGGMPAAMLPNMPAAQKLMPQQTGAAPPGTPQSLGQPEPGEAPTASESAIQSAAANAPRPIGPETQAVYQRQLMTLAQKWGPQAIAQMQPMLHDAHDLELAEAGIGSLHEAQANADKAADIAEKQGKGAQAQAEATKADNIPFPEMGVVYHPSSGTATSVTGGQVMSPAMLESKYVMDQATKQRTGQSPDPQFDKGYEKFKTIVPQFNINLAASGGGLGPSAGGAGGGTGPATKDQIPAAIRGRVEAALDYRQPLPPAGRNNPINNAISEWVYKVDPQHDETMFPARNKMMSAMTSGPEATQINAINTALGHVGVLNDAIDALKNSDGGVKALRNIANKIGVQVGDTPVTTLNTIIHRVGPELTAAYVQGGGGEGERGTTAADFDPSLSNKQLKDNVAVTAQLLRSKIGSIENQYKNTMGRNDFQQRFITPEAKNTLQKLSPQGGGGGMPPGATHTGIGSVDKKKHYLDAQGNDLGLAE